MFPCSLSKTLVRVRVERVRSQKPGSGVCADRGRSQKPLADRVLTVLALKICADRGRSQKPGSGLCYCVRSQKPCADRVLSQKIYSGSVDLEEHLLARRATADCGDRRPKGYF